MAQIRFALAGVCLGLACAVLAQAPHRLTATEGLPSNTVYDVAFDDEGWMWLATAAGLYRYDGVDFLPHRSSRARHVETHNLQRGPGGRLYVQNFRKQLFRVAGDSLEVVADLGTDWRDFASYAALRAGLLVYVDSVAFAVDYETLARRRVSLAGGGKAPGDMLKVVVRASDDLALAIGRAGELRLGCDGRRAFAVAPGLSPRAYVTTATADEAGAPPAAVFEERDGLRVRALSDGRALGPPLPMPPQLRRVGVAHRLSDGGLLLGGVGGLLRWSAGGTWEEVLREGEVSAVTRAPDGALWVGTLDRGLVALPRGRSDLGAAAAQRQDYSTLGSGITSLATAPRGLYGATRRGELYRLVDGRAERLAQAREALTLWRDGEGGLNMGRDLSVGRDGSVAPLEDALLARTPGQVKAAVPMGEGLVAYATTTEASVAGDTAAARRWLGASLPSPSARVGSRGRYVLYNGRTYGVAYDPGGGRLWAACSNGLSVSDSAGGTREVEDEALRTTPTAVAVLPDGRAAVGTSGGGLVLVSLAEATGEPQVDRVGVRGRQVGHLLADGRSLWVTTEVGVSRCSVSAGGGLRCERLAEGFGLPKRAPNAIAADDARVYFAYGSTVLAVDERATPRAPTAAVARLARVEVGGRDRALPGPGEPLRVEAGAISVSLVPRAPRYVPGEPSDFRYRIPSLGGGWRRTGERGAEIFLASLPPGRHRIEYGVDDAMAPVSAVEVVAAYPWYRRPLTWGLCGVVLFTLALAVVRRRYRRRTRELQLVNALRRSRLAAISAQMNPHFVFNALNSIQEYIIGRDPVAASDYLSELAQLMRLTLDHSRNETVSLRDEVEAMRTYVSLERLRHGAAVSAVVTVDPRLNLYRRCPPLLVQPYVENAFKHGLVSCGGGDRSFRLSYRATDPEHVTIVVEDGGIGRAAAAARGAAHPRRRLGGFGMSGSARRVELVNAVAPGTIAVTVEDLFGPERRAIGTRVTLVVRVADPVSGTSPHPRPRNLTS